MRIAGVVPVLPAALWALVNKWRVSNMWRERFKSVFFYALECLQPLSLWKCKALYRLICYAVHIQQDLLKACCRGVKTMK